MYRLSFIRGKNFVTDAVEWLENISDETLARQVAESLVDVEGSNIAYVLLWRESEVVSAYTGCGVWDTFWK